MAKGGISQECQSGCEGFRFIEGKPGAAIPTAGKDDCATIPKTNSRHEHGTIPQNLTAQFQQAFSYFDHVLVSIALTPTLSHTHTRLWSFQ
jgi:hypothetical protein